eukprot:scaffold44805_cov37-Prasinocladus_malaysianus.AAC.1
MTHGPADFAPPRKEGWVVRYGHGLRHRHRSPRLRTAPIRYLRPAVWYGTVYRTRLMGGLYALPVVPAPGPVKNTVIPGRLSQVVREPRTSVLMILVCRTGAAMNCPIGK